MDDMVGGTSYLESQRFNSFNVSLHHRLDLPATVPEIRAKNGSQNGASSFEIVLTQSYQQGPVKVAIAVMHHLESI